MAVFMIVKHVKRRQPSKWDTPRFAGQFKSAVVTTSNQPSRADELLLQRTARILGALRVG
jgi:hypothetical protein